jgi:hypothetical protein
MSRPISARATIENAEHAEAFAQWLREFIARLPQPATADWMALMQGLARCPERTREIQERYYKLHMEMWLHVLGEGPAPAQPVGPDPGDHRFDHPDWDTLPWFRYLKQTYLINARWMRELLDLTELTELTGPSKRRADFLLRHILTPWHPPTSPRPILRHSVSHHRRKAPVW